MFEKAKGRWNKKKNISYVVYSFLFIINFIAVSLSLSEVSAFSSTPTMHSISGSGNWNDSNTWLEGRVPTSDDIVLIA